MDEVKTEQKIPEIRIGEIMKMLPHRAPFLLVDRLKDVIPGESGIGIKNITFNEPFFQGHFPENPIMPGVLQVEAMAQTAGIIVLTSFPEEERAGNSVYFMTINDVKFRKPVLPGDVLEFHVKKEQTVRNVFKFRGEAFVDGKLVSQAVFSAMILKKK
ncbi:MAG: 3-hydroxyacyl-ACP dehydratase FabZ [Alphaproteobacteria bacterium]|nr:3-hydroxyacyl-ACP dehydratase FabZ [Alphaproteobacteria bacterium]